VTHFGSLCVYYSTLASARTSYTKRLHQMSSAVNRFSPEATV
jgi:hypothetical protein